MLPQLRDWNGFVQAHRNCFGACPGAAGYRHGTWEPRSVAGLWHCGAFDGAAGLSSATIWSENTRIRRTTVSRPGSAGIAPKRQVGTTRRRRTGRWSGGKVAGAPGARRHGRATSGAVRYRSSRRCAPPMTILEAAADRHLRLRRRRPDLQYNRRAVELWGRTPEPGQTHDEFTAHIQFFRPRAATSLPRSKLAEVLSTGKARAQRGGHGRARRRRDRIAVLVNIDPARCARQADRRDQLLPGRHRAQAGCSMRSDRSQQDLRAAAGALELDLRARRDRHRRDRRRRPLPARQRGDLLDRRLRPARSCSAGGCSRRTHPDDRDVDERALPPAGGGRASASIRSRSASSARTAAPSGWAVRSSTVRDADGKFLYGVRVVQDITERKEAEERQKLLIDELNHRVKNTLATVQSLATQTARGTDTPEAFRQAFEGRLIALSQAHDQLTRRHWRSADLRDIVRRRPRPTSAARADQIAIEGEADHADAAHRADAGAGAARADHQRRRNTARCRCPRAGSQSRWRLQRGRAKPSRLRIEWRERDGPPVIAPERRGFGSRFIEGSVADRAAGHRQAGVRARPGWSAPCEIPFDAAKSPAGSDAVDDRASDH